jgi:hypothetical protein
MAMGKSFSLPHTAARTAKKKGYSAGAHLFNVFVSGVKKTTTLKLNLRCVPTFHMH